MSRTLQEHGLLKLPFLHVTLNIKKNPLLYLRTIARTCVGHTLNTTISSISLVIKVNLQETNYKTTKVKVNPNTIHIHQHNQDSSKDS